MNLIKELFSIIKSLTKKEKLRFTELAEQSGSKKKKRYYMLYLLLESQDNFDEIAVENFYHSYTKKQFSDDKQYLQEQLVNLLKMRLASEIPKVDVIDNLSNAQILLKAGAYGLAKKSIDTAYNIAQKNNYVIYQYKALEDKMSLLGLLNASNSEYLKISEELGLLLVKMKQVQQISNFTIRLSEYTQAYASTQKKKFKELCHKLLDEWNSISNHDTMDKSAYILELNFLVGLYSGCEEFESALELIEKGLSIIAEDRDKHYMTAFLTLTWVTNGVTISLRVQDTSRANIFYEKLSKIENSEYVKLNETLDIEFKKVKTRLKIEILFASMDFQGIIDREKEITLFSKIQTSFTEDFLPSVSQLAWSYFFLKDYRKAYNFILQNLPLNAVKETYINNLNYYVLKALIELETEDYINANNTIRNLTRLIKKSSPLAKEDALIYKFLSSIYSYRNLKGSLLKVKKATSDIGTLTPIFLIQCLMIYIELNIKKVQDD